VGVEEIFPGRYVVGWAKILRTPTNSRVVRKKNVVQKYTWYTILSCVSLIHVELASRITRFALIATNK
jgi:hypothetical protein